MLSRHPFVVPPTSDTTFEQIHDDEYLVVEETNTLNENGDYVVEYRDNVRKIDEKQTPQTGIEAQIHDIAFALRHNIKIDDKPAYLSLSGSGNPFTEAQFSRALAQNMEKALEESSKKSNNKDN